MRWLGGVQGRTQHSKHMWQQPGFRVGLWAHAFWGQLPGLSTHHYQPLDKIGAPLCSLSWTLHAASHSSCPIKCLAIPFCLPSQLHVLRCHLSRQDTLHPLLLPSGAAMSYVVLCGMHTCSNCSSTSWNTSWHLQQHLLCCFGSTSAAPQQLSLMRMSSVTDAIPPCACRT